MYLVPYFEKKRVKHEVVCVRACKGVGTKRVERMTKICLCFSTVYKTTRQKKMKMKYIVLIKRCSSGLMYEKRKVPTYSNTTMWY